MKMRWSCSVCGNGSCYFHVKNHGPATKPSKCIFDVHYPVWKKEYKDGKKWVATNDKLKCGQELGFC